MHYRLSSLLIYFLTLTSCHYQTSDKTIQQDSLLPVQTAVGSDFAINLPDNYKVVSHQGKDYTDYGFVPTDTTNKTAAVAGLILGPNVGCYERFLDSTIHRDTISSIILEKKADWIRFKIDSLYYAESFLESEYCASIQATNKEDIDKFITVFKSLKH